MLLHLRNYYLVGKPYISKQVLVYRLLGSIMFYQITLLGTNSLSMETTDSVRQRLLHGCDIIYALRLEFLR